MKSLQEFIIEQVQVNEEASSKTITFNFKDLENDEETLKSFEDKEYCTIDGEKLTVTVTPDNFDKLEEVVKHLQEYTSTIRNSTKRSADETYAQKTKSFEEKMDDLNKAIEEFTQSSKEEDTKKEEE